MRQRENRRLKQERLVKVARRRKFAKRGGIVLVVAAVVVGIAFAVNATRGPSKKSTTTTTAATAVGYPCTPLPSEQTGAIHFSTCPKMTIDTSHSYTATVATDVGTIVITLDPKSAPISVNNFVFLAEHGYYNGVTFHRVIPGFMMQGGDPTGTGSGGPGYEYTEHGPPVSKNPSLQYPDYSVAMANSGAGPSKSATDPGTNGSQFFIVDGDEGESLPPDYVLFGQVTSGTSIVDKIVADGSQAGVPPTVTHRMLSITISVNGKPVPEITTTTAVPKPTTPISQATSTTASSTSSTNGSRISLPTSPTTTVASTTSTTKGS